MSQSRITRSGSKIPSGIGGNFLSITHATGQSGPSNTTPRSPSAHSTTPERPAEDEGNQEENFPLHEDNDPDPDQDDDQDRNQDETAAQPDRSLARSLELLANKIASFPAAPKPKSMIKHRVPDVFDGTDPAKLDTFLFQCAMFVSACSQDFPDEESKVAFVLSYLKGVPLDWFQGEMSLAISSTGVLPAWFTTFPKFLDELRRLFGPRDPVADATNALEALKYKDSSKAPRYTIEFNRHAHRTGWNDTALTRQYYKGLPDRLKDEIARIGKPAGLQDLQALVATLDQRYWERQSEISRDKRSSAAPNASTSQHKSTSSDNRNDNRGGSSNATGSRSNNNNSNNQQSKNKDQKKPQSAANSSNSGNKTNTISELLGPDGKLKPEERQRRMDNNLCLRCGKPGHKVNDCPVTSKAKPKGRAATVASTSAAAPAANASGKA